MKYLMISLMISSLFGFKVEFENHYKTTIFPNIKAIFINSNKVQINYKPKIILDNGIVLLNYPKADDYVRNSLYLPNNVNAENVNVAIFNIDKARNKILHKLNKYYKNCTLDKIIFQNNNYKSVYFKPTTIQINSKVILDCK